MLVLQPFEFIEVFTPCARHKSIVFHDYFIDSFFFSSTAEKSESALQALTSAYEKYGHGDISGGSNHHADSEESDLQNNK